MGRLEGKVAVVTGMATGLGREIALRFAEEGARVVGCDIRSLEGEETIREINSRGGEARFVHADVRSGPEMKAVVEAAEDYFGALHIMTANAGTMGRADVKPFLEITEEEFTEIVSVNLTGVFNSYRYAVPAILRAGGGAMSATASSAAHQGFPRLSAYSASKGGVITLSRALASELGPMIRVNVVSAGGGRQSQIRAHSAELRGAAGEKLVSLDHPVGFRSLDAREGAEAHLFVVSEEASGITGQVIVVDIGRSVMPFGRETGRDPEG